MINIDIRNYHQIVPRLLSQLLRYGVRHNHEELGLIIYLLEPMNIYYTYPNERTMFWSSINMNPISQMMYGLSAINQNIQDIKECAEKLKKVKRMESVVLFATSPLISFLINHRCELEMLTEHRKEELIGNSVTIAAVTCSFIQEILAHMLGCKIGPHRQRIHDSYTVVGQTGILAEEVFHAKRFKDCPYETKTVSPYPLIQGDIEQWLQDLSAFLSDIKFVGLKEQFFRRVTSPLMQAFEQAKNSDYSIHEVLASIRECKAQDWQMASRWFYEKKQ